MFHPVLTPYYCIFIYSTEEEGNENNYQISSYDIDYEAEQVQAGKIWLTNKGMSFTSMDFQKRILSYFEFDEKPK